MNTNQSNLENLNGLYIPKGFGNISSFYAEYTNKYFTFSIEPSIVHDNNFENINLPRKKGIFSVLNDVPLDKDHKLKIHDLRNAGIKLRYGKIEIGYGNWDQWWGYGFHNSLAFSNNARGIYSYFIQTAGTFKKIKYDLKYSVSDGLKNHLNSNYFLSSYFFKVGNNFFEIGKSKIIESGGYNDRPWSLKDAMFIPITNRDIKYWDVITNYHLLLNFKKSGLKVFIELGSPNITNREQQLDGIRSKTIMGSNIGFRKYGLFNNKNLILGFEYTRLVQGHYYNLFPTPNWYQNKNYNYSSYNGRRWGAHSGADSDDFLIYSGFIGNRLSFIIGANYERHGVTYNFPPEIKFEKRIKIGYIHKNLSIFINYENEYFRHYGFVDKNKNVWLEEFESGSIQRTNTILFTLEHRISFQ